MNIKTLLVAAKAIVSYSQNDLKVRYIEYDIEKYFNVTRNEASKIITELFKEGYLKTGSRPGIASLTKKACDEIRKYNASK